MATRIAAIREKAEEIRKGTAVTSGPDPPWAVGEVMSDDERDGEASASGLVKMQTVKFSAAPHTKAAPVPLVPHGEDEEGDEEEDMIALKMSSGQHELLSSNSHQERADDEELTSLQARHT